MSGKIINFNPNKFENKERFDKNLKIELCEHNKSLTYDEDFGTIECDSCNKKYSEREFMQWWTQEKGNNQAFRMEFYNTQNKHWHLSQEVSDLETQITFLKKEKSRLTREVNKLKKL
ncbi:hypothetical protein [Algoriella sp.]|uniref:hypothetical protein n=1 Tax=Algoriella sp. TaxID=1872434 RepID=UPI002FC8685A